MPAQAWVHALKAGEEEPEARGRRGDARQGGRRGGGGGERGGRVESARAGAVRPEHGGGAGGAAVCVPLEEENGGGRRCVGPTGHRNRRRESTVYRVKAGASESFRVPFLRR
jgi:hypothetical protein